MFKKICLLFFLSLISYMSASAGIEAIKGKVSNGYDYWFYTPSQENATVEDQKNGKPLIIFLHGASLCGNDLEKVKRYGTINAIEKGRKIDAYVIAPQNPGGAWKPEKIMNIVDYVSANHKVDKNRIYVLGMSLGGYGAIDFAATYPDRVAAAIGMCGGASVKKLDGLARIPLWIVHGTADQAVSISQSDKVVEAIKASQKDGVNRLSYDRVAGMNHSQPARMFYKDETYQWLMSHRLNTPGRPITPTVKVTNEYLSNAYSGLNHSKGYRAKSQAKTKSNKAAASKSSKTTASKSTKSKGNKSSKKRRA